MSSSNSMEEISQRLVYLPEIRKPKVCIAIAGGGGHAIASLAATPGASSLLLEGTVTYDRNSFHAYLEKSLNEDFGYVSLEAAQLLSQAALSRALSYQSGSFRHQSQCVGVGSSSALVQSKPGRLSRGHIVATHADGRTWQCFLSLAPHKRSRLEEDLMFSQLILESIEQIVAETKPPITITSSLQDNDKLEHQLHCPSPEEDPVRIGAERVLSGGSPAIVLLPREDDKSFVAMPETVLPYQSLIFPGSFNPPHGGHVALANAAAAAFHSTSSAVLMELSLLNADKPSLDADTVVERAYKFFQLENLPANWGILLTSAPLFSEKATILQDCIVRTDSDADGPLMSFVIGTDTMVRILNPKYYGDSQDAMLEAVRDMKRQGVHFVVGGRLQQDTLDENKKFITGEEELADLPKDVQEMFTLVKEQDFRVDISSTELRKQATSKEATKAS